MVADLHHFDEEQDPGRIKVKSRIPIQIRIKVKIGIRIWIHIILFPIRNTTVQVWRKGFACAAAFVQCTQVQENTISTTERTGVCS